MGDFEGRVAVVTGAASGLGLGLATRLVERGARVVMGDLAEEVLTERARRLGPPRSALAVPVDVSIGESVEDLRRRTEAAFGPADLIFNNAGVNTREESPGSLSLAEWEWVLGVNLWGVVHGVRTFLPGLIERGRGHLVNTASGKLFEPQGGYGPYVTSKWGVAGLTASIHDEIRKKKLPIGVSLLCPWIVKTGLHDIYRAWPERLGPLPAGVVPGDPDPGWWDRKGAANPVDVADEVLDAVQEGRYWITPGFRAMQCVLQPPLDTRQPWPEN
jgi:NAD(P)-dependent dehydrogenase (short-subunit alcohol dehydrogenase family)